MTVSLSSFSAARCACVKDAYSAHGRHRLAGVVHIRPNRWAKCNCGPATSVMTSVQLVTAMSSRPYPNRLSLAERRARHAREVENRLTNSETSDERAYQRLLVQR